MGKLIMIRHGKSIWNVKNIFTGWTDVDLAPEGIEEAKKAGELMKKNNITIDICFSSFLKRAIRTNWIILDTMDMMYIDCHYNWQLNERHYGAWQGRDKDKVKKEVGDEIFWKIRRGYDTPPPSLALDDKRHPKCSVKYKNIDSSLLPLAESLKDTRKRAVHYFFENIAPQIVDNRTVLVTAHGNSIRALMAQIQDIPPETIPKIEVPTCVPYIYDFDDNLNLLEDYQLGQRSGKH
jgi:2,3-bisphosphoglycerate-dependent phosphoglycerate mutase